MPHEWVGRVLRDFGVSALSPGEADHARTDVAAHPGEQRVGLPPGSTRFDWSAGEVRHLDSDTVLTDQLPTVEEMDSLGDSKEDSEALRSVLAFCDVGCTLEIAGSEIPLDPCNYFPIRRRAFRSLTLTTKLPAEAYVVASSRSEPFADVVSHVMHSNRVGTYDGTPDSWSPVAFETVPSAENGDLGADARRAPLHVQEFEKRTWTVENTGTNDVEVRLVGKTTHTGPFVDVDPADQPVTVASGSTETLTLNSEAWHVVKLEARNLTTGNSVTLDVHYAGVTS